MYKACDEVPFLKTFKEPLTPKEEKKYLERYAQGDKLAKDILIESNLRLVAHVAKKYSGEIMKI